MLLHFILPPCYKQIKRNSAICTDARYGYLYQKSKMPRTSQKRLTDELKTVITFLNKDPDTLPRGILFDGLDGERVRTERRDEWTSLRFALANLLAPDLLVLRQWRPAFRKRQTAFYKRYAPKFGLMHVVKKLNARAVRPRWGMVAQAKRAAKISIPGFTGSVVKQEFGDSVWQAVARLLESGDIAWISQCPICGLFFVKNREWQKCCPKAQCRKHYENRLAADRQARVRRKRKRK